MGRVPPIMNDFKKEPRDNVFLNSPMAFIHSLDNLHVGTIATGLCLGLSGFIFPRRIHLKEFNPCRAFLEICLSTDWIKSAVRCAVSQPLIQFRVCRIGDGQIPGAEQKTFGNRVSSGFDNGIQSNRYTGFYTSPPRGHSNPLSILDS